MKSYDVLDAIGGIDPKFLAEAENRPEASEKSASRGKRWLGRWLALAACLVIVVGAVGIANRNNIGTDHDEPLIDEQEKEAIMIPKMKVALPSEDAEADMVAFFIYDGRSYVQYYGGNGNDKTDKAIKGEYLGWITGSIDEWTAEDDYIDMTGSIGGAIYTVEGFDPKHILCMEWGDGSGISLYVNDNDLTLYDGSDILEDIFDMSDRYRGMTFESIDSFYNGKGDIREIDGKNNDAVKELIKDLDGCGYVSELDMDKIFDDALYRMYFDIGNGIKVDLTLYKNDIIRINGFRNAFLKLEEGKTDQIIELMS